MTALLRRGLAAWGLDAEKAEPLAAFAALVLEKNRVMNLTAITAPEDVARLHLLDSAAPLTVEPFAGKRAVDVGTGAGFPGVPLRILTPELRLTLLDSHGRRVRFLEECAASLGLERVEFVCARAEEYALSAARETFDIAVARAVAPLPLLCELCLPLVRPGGVFLAMKSIYTDAEIEASAHAIAQLGGAAPSVHDYTIPESDVRHRIIRIPKPASTPISYPRPFGKMKKRPL